MSKGSAYFQISHIAGNHDTKELKQELDTIPGVLSVSVNVEKNTLGVDYDNAGVTCVFGKIILVHSELKNVSTSY